MNYKPPQSPALSLPITTSNVPNANNHPAQVLGYCTPSQLVSQVGAERGTACILGNPARSLSLVRILQRRSGKPLLFIGTAMDREIATALAPDRIVKTLQPVSGSCAVLLDRVDAYMELVEQLKKRTQSHFIVLRLGNGLSLGGDALSVLSAGQSAILTDWVPQAVRSGGEWATTPLDFLKQMKCVFAASCCGAQKELVEILPTYRYENVSNTTGYNTFHSHAILRPLHIHCGRGFSASQTRTADFKKSAFEADELIRLFENGTTLAYNAVDNKIFLAQVL